MKKVYLLGLGIGCTIVAVSGAVVFLASVLRKPVIACYRIPEQHIASVQAIVGQDAHFLVYENQTSLYSQVRQGKRPDVILTPGGNPLHVATELASKKVALAPALLEGVTSSVRNSVPRAAKNTQAFAAVPLLSSHFEVDINTKQLQNTTIKTINTWEDIDRFVREAKEKNPNTFIVFAGKDGETVLDLLGAYTEAFGGIAQYQHAVTLIQQTLQDNAAHEKPLNSDELAHLLTKDEDAPLFDAVQFLGTWFAQGLIFSDVFSMTRETVAAFMANDMASVVFMTLADHRAIDHTVIASFTSIYFPSEASANQRHFIAPVYYAVPYTTHKKGLALTGKLVDVEAQELLCRTTGLAPVLARCRVPDRQADDARFWVAATNAPLAGLSKESTMSDEQITALATALANCIRVRN